MMVFQITGGMLRAARSLTGLSQKKLAERGGLSRHSIRERSSDSITGRDLFHTCAVSSDMLERQRKAV